MGPLVGLLIGRIARRGPLPFDEFMEAALYHPQHGFYATGGQAGRRGDFVTSPEVGPLFGVLVARAIDRWWVELGSPDPYVVVEAAAGRGALARSVLAAQPACAAALRYVMVERSAALRARQGEHLDLVPPAFAFGPAVDEDGPPVARTESAGGPVVVSLPHLPSIDGPVVVLANELLDNLAFRVLERTGDGWLEVRAAAPADDASGDVAAPHESGPQLNELLVPAPEQLSDYADRLVSDAPEGARIPVQEGAVGWLRRAIDTAGPGGRVVVFDYCATTTMLAHRPWVDWLRTYAGHGRGGRPLLQPGTQDITADVCVDQLARIRPLTSDRSQAEFLTELGIEELVEEGRRIWAEQAHIGDLEAIRGRSRVTEAEALVDAGGLGAFRVLEWET